MLKRKVDKGKVRINGRFYKPANKNVEILDGTILRFMLTNNATIVYRMDSTGLVLVDFWEICTNGLGRAK